MVNREQFIASATERLALAPFKSDEWIHALEFLAKATGSSRAHIAGWVAPNEIPFMLATDGREGMKKPWLEVGGADPARNPIVCRGTTAAVLEVISDAEVISRDARKHHPMWRDFYDKFGIPHICYTPLWREDSIDLMLTVPRSARDGVIRKEERKAFFKLAQRFQHAALVTRALKNEGTQVLTGAFDAISIAAIVVDGFGRIIAVTRAAEPVLREGKSLRVIRGRLQAADVIAHEFELALGNCINPSNPAASRISIAACDGGSAVTFSIASLPHDDHEIGFGAAAIVIIEAQSRDVHIMLGPDAPATLTPAENEVALALLQGIRPTEIAIRRNVSIETVRSQIKSLYSKVGVTGHIEFIAKARSSASSK